MPFLPISLSRSAIAALDDRGLRLSGLFETRSLTANSRIEAPTSILALVPSESFLDVGAFCNLSGGTIGHVRFGRYGSMASGAVIGAHEHPIDWLTTSRTAYYPQVNGWDEIMAGAEAPKVRQLTRAFRAACPITTIGPDVWIGQGAFIRAGVTIGAGAVIGARAAVVRDVPPYAIVVGVPGKVVRLRFPDAIVERLLAVEWWRYSIYDLFDAPFDRIDEALDVIEAKIGSGAVRPFAGREVGPADLADPLALAAELAGAPIARAS